VQISLNSIDSIFLKDKITKTEVLTSGNYLGKRLSSRTTITQKRFEPEQKGD
jgi:hypothetical protein